MNIGNMAEVYSELADQIEEAVIKYRKENTDTKYPINFCYVAVVPVEEYFLSIYTTVRVTKKTFSWFIIKEEPVSANEYLDLKSENA